MTDCEIYNHVFNTLVLNKKTFINFQPQENISREDTIKGMISQREIKRSQRFIDVSFTLKSGEKLKYSFATLYHKWGNMDDSLGILRYAGITVEKLTLQVDGTSTTKQAEEFLGTVSTNLILLVDQFQTNALQVMQ